MYLVRTVLDSRTSARLAGRQCSSRAGNLIRRTGRHMSFRPILAATAATPFKWTSQRRTECDGVAILTANAQLGFNDALLRRLSHK